MLYAFHEFVLEKGVFVASPTQRAVPFTLTVQVFLQELHYAAPNLEGCVLSLAPGCGSNANFMILVQRS